MGATGFSETVVNIRIPGDIGYLDENDHQNMRFFPVLRR
jgi:hypothetical protein